MKLFLSTILFLSSSAFASDNTVLSCIHKYVYHGSTQDWQLEEGYKIVESDGIYKLVEINYEGVANRVEQARLLPLNCLTSSNDHRIMECTGEKDGFYNNSTETAYFTLSVKASSETSLNKSTSLEETHHLITLSATSRVKRVSYPMFDIKKEY